MRSIAGLFALGLVTLGLSATADASTGTCDVSPGEYTAWTGSAADLETASTSTAGVSEARCLKDVRASAAVVEGVFKDGKGRFANELPSYGKLVNLFPGENGNTICNGFYGKGQRNTPAVYCVSGWTKAFTEVASYANALDWKYVNPVRYDPATRTACPSTFPAMGCFGGRCYDSDCVKPDGTLTTCPSGQYCKSGACVAGDGSTLPACTVVDPQTVAITDGNPNFYFPWNSLVFDLGGLANKVAIFAVNDHGPQPCESNEYTVFLTNNPGSRDIIDNPTKDGADPTKWNRAKLFKIYTHGWIDNPDCCDDPKSCATSTCTQPKPGDNPVLEADSMSLVFSLPCGISFRYAAFIAGYDGKGLGDPAAGPDRCAYHSFDAEIDAVAGLNDDESAICPDNDGDGFPTCDCTPKPSPCDCVDDPKVNPDAKKYHPGAPQACDGPQYSCAPQDCPTGTTCHDGVCVKPCDPGEFKCVPGFTCTSVPTDAGTSEQVCVPAPCGDAGVCPPGFSCVGNTCVDPCAMAKCPPGQSCSEGKCVDPCALIKCPAGQSCLSGKCVDNCACLAKSAADYPCKDGTPTCDVKAGTCVPDGCDKLVCPSGKTCVSSGGVAACKGKCEDVVCPGKQVCDDTKGCVDPCDLLKTPCDTGKACKDGVCVDAECVNVDCTGGTVCDHGKCVDPGSTDLCFSCDSGTGEVDSGSNDGDASTGFVNDDTEKDGGGCNCSMPGGGAAKGMAMLASVGLLLGLARRRRR